MSNLIIGKINKNQINDRNSTSQYEKILTTDKSIFNFDENVFTLVIYNPDSLLGDNDIFYIDNFTEKEFCPDICKSSISSANYNDIKTNDLNKLQYILIENNKFIFFQRTTKSIISKKKFINFNGNFSLEDNPKVLIIKENPDAIFDKKRNRLYFKKLENISNIFNGIDSLYKEATEEETKSFINKRSIKLIKNFKIANVNKTNRKKITSINNYLKDFDENNFPKLIDYIKFYCEEIPLEGNFFQIENNNQLSKILFGFQERYFTTEICKIPYIANSIIDL